MSLSVQFCCCKCDVTLNVVKDVKSFHFFIINVKVNHLFVLYLDSGVDDCEDHSVDDGLDDCVDDGVDDVILDSF